NAQRGMRRVIHVPEHPVLRAIARPVVADLGAVAVEWAERIVATGSPAEAVVYNAAVTHVIAGDSVRLPAIGGAAMVRELLGQDSLSQWHQNAVDVVVDPPSK